MLSGVTDVLLWLCKQKILLELGGEERYTFKPQPQRTVGQVFLQPCGLRDVSEKKCSAVSSGRNIMEEGALQKTPLHAWHVANGAQMGPFAGWDMPIQYPTGILTEHKHTRASASIFDICHMGQVLVRGSMAEEALGKTLTHNLKNLAVNKCAYGFLLNEQGGILDDLIVYRLGPEHFLLVLNAACTATDIATIHARLEAFAPPRTVKLEDITAYSGKIDLQGPASADILENIFLEPFKDLPYFTCKHITFEGASLTISRTGYTGELGYELYPPRHLTEALWDTLMGDVRVEPAGLGARDTLRLEAGLPLYGHELDEKHTPAEAAMGRMLKSEADYAGKSHALDERQILTPLMLEGRRSAQPGNAVLLPDNTPCGVVTSASFAPSLNRAIAFAYIDKAHAASSQFLISAAKAIIPASVTTLPFYKEGSVRIKFTS